MNWCSPACEISELWNVTVNLARTLVLFTRNLNADYAGGWMFGITNNLAGLLEWFNVVRHLLRAWNSFVELWWSIFRQWWSYVILKTPLICCWCMWLINSAANTVEQLYNMSTLCLWDMKEMFGFIWVSSLMLPHSVIHYSKVKLVILINYAVTPCR